MILDIISSGQVQGFVNENRGNEIALSTCGNKRGTDARHDAINVDRSASPVDARRRSIADPESFGRNQNGNERWTELDSSTEPQAIANAGEGIVDRARGWAVEIEEAGHGQGFGARGQRAK